MRFIGCVALLVVGSTQIFASDWAQWRGPAQTGYVPAGVPVPSTLPVELKPVWKNKIGEGFASPVVSGGKVFYLDNQAGTEVLHAVKAETGEELWHASIFACHKDGFGIGPRCAPLVDGKYVYAQACKGELQCLNVEDGKQIWRKNYVDDFGAVFIGEIGKAAGGTRHGNSGSPTIDGENIIAMVGSTKGAGVVCMKKATGEVVWKSQNDQAGYAPPVIATIAGVKQVVAFTAEALLGLDIADGHQLWRVPIKTALGRHVTTPVIVDDIVIVSSHQVGLIATKITKDANGLKADQLWLKKEFAINFASPVVVGKNLYGLGPAKNIICVDVQSGELAWEQAGCIVSNPDKAHASFVVMDKNILLLNDSGQFILFPADPKAYKEISRVQVCGFNWCNPAYADGKVYLRDAKELMCIELLK